MPTWARGDLAEEDLRTGLRLRGNQQVDAGEEPRFQSRTVQPRGAGGAGWPEGDGHGGTRFAVTSEPWAGARYARFSWNIKLTLGGL